MIGILIKTLLSLANAKRELYDRTISILFTTGEFLPVVNTLCNSYTVECPPVRGDIPRDLASILSYVLVDNHGLTNFFFHQHQCRPCTSRDSSCLS